MVPPLGGKEQARPFRMHFRFITHPAQALSPEFRRMSL